MGDRLEANNSWKDGQDLGVAVISSTKQAEGGEQSDRPPHTLSQSKVGRTRH